MNKKRLAKAYRDCGHLAGSHYENFPVASCLVPKKYRRAIHVIYCFARIADDIADEGDDNPQERLANLQALEQQLDDIEHGREPAQDIGQALGAVIKQYQLPVEPFHQLLSAFRMDVTRNRFQDFPELIHYCRHSANPIGRLLLVIYDASTEENIGYADALCTALQLINFLQDMQQDLQQRDRIYIPQDEMRRYGVTEEDLLLDGYSPALRRLLDFQIQRALRLLQAGAPLAIRLPGRIGVELRMIVLGGWHILKKLHNQRHEAFTRPHLDWRDWLRIIPRAIFGRFTIYLDRHT